MKLADGTVIPSSFSGVQASSVSPSHKSHSLKQGIVISARTIDADFNESSGFNNEGLFGSPNETVYDVRVDDNSSRTVMYTGCRILRPWFGTRNYFDIVHESANQSTSYVEKLMMSTDDLALAGSKCVIMCVEGELTTAVILGFLNHKARTSNITADMGNHLEFEWNGFKTSIDKDGALLIEANGPWIDPVTTPIGPVPDNAIRANPLVGPFTVSLDKDMVFTIKDNKDQMFQISRTDGTITLDNGSESIILTGEMTGGGDLSITSGKIINIIGPEGTIECETSLDILTKDLSITVDNATTLKSKTIDFKADGDFSSNSDNLNFTAKSSFLLKSSDASIKTDTDTNIEAQNITLKSSVAFAVEATTLSLKGSTGELLTLIAELIDAVGALTAASPTGPCAPLTGAPQWAQVLAISTKIKGMTG